ncbi:MAG TPA: hypothetical protein VMC08_04975 [Bacteroidales bacterium]|nr:hypothetical protein [Bacteroidales bacterium]
MKKVIISLIAGSVFFLLTFSETQAQSRAPVDPVSQGDWILNFGIGAGNPYFNNGYGFGPGFKVAFEGALWQVGPGVFTIGGELGFSYFAYTYANILDVKYREHWINFMIGARSAYHYGFKVKGLDVYAGIPLGIGFSAYHYDYYDESWWHGYHPVFPYVGIFFGTSYFFNPVIGINAEIGYSATYAQIGMVFKIK